ILIVGACACSPFARGQSGSPAQNALGVESPQQMQARISKLEAEVAELKAIVDRLQPARPPLKRLPPMPPLPRR
ncbi:MAG TPA: hypothetical protein VHT31_01155, partial [Candidatus Acidoferrum sp.]|nr:hypothetical protein [Candidatus Acidoferrum sp.]